MNKGHIKTAHGEEKPFKCAICEAKFTMKNSLTTHIATVHEEKKPFKCHLCGADFAKKQNLNGHITRVHEDSNVTNVGLIFLKNKT